jgi:MFS family permease
MSSVFSLPPLLFAALQDMYGISYTLLGTLVLTNFCTQLTVDLIFTFFSKHFDCKKIVKSTPAITLVGLLIYGIMPNLFPSHAYLWLMVGTVIFSAAAGFGEVLTSPVVAAIPSDNPEREMSKLHSVYAWGVVGVVIFGTVFLRLVGMKNWMYLVFVFLALPILAWIFFGLSTLPDLKGEDESSGGKRSKFGAGLLLCAVCIFLGGASELAMNQWSSSYIEKALSVPKLVGDICGMAGFAAMLGIGRSLYAKYGKNILKFMLFGMAGATLCYLAAAISDNAIVGVVACALCGFCVSMLWPGNIIIVGEKFPSAGVAAYALMAAAGDLGGSVGPQLVGAIADGVVASDFASELCARLSISAEQLGMRAGLLVSALFPLLGFVVVLVMMRYFKKRS